MKFEYLKSRELIKHCLLGEPLNRILNILARETSQSLLDEISFIKKSRA